MRVFGKRVTRLRMIFVLLAVVPWSLLIGALIAIIGTFLGAAWWPLGAP